MLKNSHNRFVVEVCEIWNFRSLLLTFVWRTLKIRYQQTALGIIWVVGQPLILTGLFSVILGKYAQLPSESLPYPLFLLTGLAVWQFCAQGFQQGSSSIVANSYLITRVYFPRILLPISSILAALFDLFFIILILIGFMFFYRVSPNIGLLYIAPFLLMAVFVVLGLSLWLGAIYVRYRDIGHILPFFTQVWMFATPVIYSFSILPEKFEWLYAINPLTNVIKVFRWGFAGGTPPSPELVVISGLSSLTILVSGIWFFYKKEGTFSDYV
jgi:lipopolysaccharide transport system permease protein